ncbi:unnamed protein product [Paramecium pentaurelia]|uniref:Peptidase S11 D-alanyl-D-alanine carboxypeptidase A N-terminal domain-containing protein n=1 Tax=Paramecium pentaurelia TaxID=43138 RepID=A0A8S1T4C6_9CILI|nr:unnamed protein product [Paramecium pentaurelia]
MIGNKTSSNSVNLVDFINPALLHPPSRKIQLIEQTKTIKLLKSYHKIPQIATEFQSPMIVNNLRNKNESLYSLPFQQQLLEKDRQITKIESETSNKTRSNNPLHSLPQIPLAIINTQAKLIDLSRTNNMIQSPQNSDTKRSLISPKLKSNSNRSNKNYTCNSTTTGSSKDSSSQIANTQQSNLTKNIMDSYYGKPRKRKLNVTAKSFIVYDCIEHKTILKRKSNKKVEVASLTKIMTFYVTLLTIELFNLNLKQIKVKVTKKSSETIGTTAELKYNDILSMEDLLYGLMLPSGNDAAVLIAQAIGTIILFQQQNKRLDLKLIDIEQLSAEGYYYNHEFRFQYCPIEVFIKQMNKYSQQIGQQNTQFACVHGLANEDNYSCCNDIITLSIECLKYELFQTVISSKEYVVKSLYKQYEWKNTNKLLDKGFFGIKTGITDSAGPCLASAYRSNEMDYYIIIVLNCKNMNMRFDDTIILLQHAKLKKMMTPIPY